MAEGAKPCASEPRGIDDAGVNELVHDEDVVLAQQRGNGPQRRGVPGRKRQRRLGAFECGKGCFEFVVDAKRATDEARSAAARAEFLNRLRRRFLEGRVIRQTEIIVGGEIQQRLCLHVHTRALR